MENLKTEYLLNPCGILSIPYWKNKNIIIPNNTIIVQCSRFNNQYNNYKRYFRLIHNLKNIKNSSYLLNNINIFEDKKQLIDMINICYLQKGIFINDDDTNKWIKHPTFNPKLWLKIEQNEKIVASGIAEYDKECEEGILEWIQVLPEYRNRGYGEAIVNFLLTELKQLGAKFVTVSGDLDNYTNPEKLYRKCGFVGDDIWYICHN